MEAREVTAVLVHAAWADGSSWAKVITGLKSQGVRALATPLPLTTFEDDVRALNRTTARAGGPTLLVGHAYAGAVVSAADPAGVKGLVCVSGLTPDEGQTVADVFYQNEPHPKAPKLGPDENGIIWMPEEAFASAFAQNATRDELAVLAAVQRPILPACIIAKVGRPLWRSLPTHYVVSKEDRMIVEKTQMFLAERMGAKIVSVKADHVPMVTAPDAVIGTILSAISEL